MITHFIFLVSFLLLGTGVTLAQEKNSTIGHAGSKDGTSVTTEVTYDYDSGTPTRLTFNVISQRKQIWLGVSAYAMKFTDPIAEGLHQQMELNGDRNGKTVTLGERFRSGSFEVAVWGKKVPKSECKIPDCKWCARKGFHLDDLLLYKSGVLGPVRNSK